MRSRIVFFLSLGAALFLAGCKHKSLSWQPVGNEFVAGTVESSSKDFVVPRELRKTVDKEYLAFIHKADPKIVLTDAEILNQVPRDFLDVSIFLKGREPGVLTSDTRFDLPRGGGEIDLADVVKGKKGSFYLHFDVKRNDSPNDPVRDLHIYFMSEAKRRKIGVDTFGIGCYRYLDVTKILLKSNLKDGLQLNATDLRYLPVIGGTLYFIGFDPARKIYVAAVRFHDSRYPELMCPKLN